MASSDERHEVAERLMERERGWRKMGTHVRVMPDRPATQFEDIAALLGFSGWVLDADVFAMLAELIDPTCHGIEELEPDGIGAPPRYTSRCSACGQVWDETCGIPRFPPYCPNCGARVTSGGER